MTLTAAGLAMLALWLYAALGHRLISREISSRLIQYHSLRAAVPPIVFLLSIPLAQWSPTAAEYSWAVIIPVFSVLRRLFRDDL
jgi:hypothetical protein